jgi:hypothetical protein
MQGLGDGRMVEIARAIVVSMSVSPALDPTFDAMQTPQMEASPSAASMSVSFDASYLSR